MNRIDDLMQTVGRIEGKLDNLTGIPERVARLEQWQAWLKGAWAFLVGAFAYLVKGIYK